MSRYRQVLILLGICLLGSFSGSEERMHAGEPNAVTAIDILLDPDATTLKKAQAVNERLAC